MLYLRGPTKAPRRTSAERRRSTPRRRCYLNYADGTRRSPTEERNSSDSTRDMSDSGRVVAGNFDELL